MKRELRALWVGAGVLAGLGVGPARRHAAVRVFSFLALREFITLAHTRRSDHRSLILAFFVVLPLQYLLVGCAHFDLFTVFIPVYVFLAIPVVSALAATPSASSSATPRSSGASWSASTA
jgi:phosphatidate cytidylyltransferase